jgi:hypothetical protein
MPKRIFSTNPSTKRSKNSKVVHNRKEEMFLNTIIIITCLISFTGQLDQLKIQFSALLLWRCSLLILPSTLLSTLYDWNDIGKRLNWCMVVSVERFQNKMNEA